MFDVSFLIFINALFLAVIGLLAQQDDKHPTRRRVWRYLGLFFVGLSLLLGQEVKNREQAQQEEQRRMEFQRNMGQFKDARERLKYERELRAKTEELAKKSDEIASLNRTIAGSVTGGDSFCYVTLSLDDAAANNPMAILIPRGDHTVFDVALRIVDVGKLQALAKKGPVTFETMAQAEINLNLGNLVPERFRMLGRWQLPADSDTQDYNLFFAARSRSFVQSIRLRRVNGRWKQAIKVQVAPPNIYPTKKKIPRPPQVLFEKIDPEFPRDDKGQVQWD